jgi:hypothetical protein
MVPDEEEWDGGRCRLAIDAGLLFRICRRSQEWQLAIDPQMVPSVPEISIESLDLNRAASYVGNDDDDDEGS